MKTLTASWYEDDKTGKGMLHIDQDETGSVRPPVEWEEPISGQTDLDAIAEAIRAEGDIVTFIERGMDSESVHVTVRQATASIGERIRQVRKAAGLTQVQAAQLAGISQPTWAGIETHGANPTVTTLTRLAKALGCQPWELLV